MSARTHSPLGTLRGNFVMLRADTLRLLLPQAEVGGAQYLDPATTAQGHDEGGRILALSSQMKLLAERPPQRFVVATLEQGGEGRRWCWDELRVLIDVELRPRALPAVLVASDTPVEHYVEHEGHIAFLCSAHRVNAYALADGSPA